MANYESPQGKVLPTTESKDNTKKTCIIKCHTNYPQLSASEIAKQFKTTPSYVWKVLSNARKTSKDIRGRNGRIFAHGKVYYEWAVMPDTVALLKAPIVNNRTGMKQIGSIKEGNPCSCQVHSNGHLIVWAHYTGWQQWLFREFITFGLRQEVARFIVEQLRIGVSVAEAGLKPLDPSFLPGELSLETEWGVVIVKDNTPEKGVLEIKLSIPDMKRYLGLPEIKKRLDVIEQGSITLNQSYKAIVALLVSLERQWRTSDQKDEKPC